jgi:glutathione S-transferase
MILVGQYDSPFVRRVSVSLRVLGFRYEHDTRSVFGDFDSMRATNPLGRVPSLILDTGETLVDSAAILDWLDEAVGSERALIPRSGKPRRVALQTIALATGAVDKIGAANYERLIRPSSLRWSEWIERCLTQCRGALDALESKIWPDKIDQTVITTACMLFYVLNTDPDLFPESRYPNLHLLAARCRAMPEFQASDWSDYQVPKGA